MTFWEAIFLALLQGVTEFLPISSSGHLVFFEYLFSGVANHSPQMLEKLASDRLSFNIFIHLGTLTSVVFYYFKDLKYLIYGGWSDGKSFLFDKSLIFSEKFKVLSRWKYLSFLFYLVVTSLVTGIVGLLLKDRVEVLYEDLTNLFWVYLIMALILYSQRYVSSARSVRDNQTKEIDIMQITLKIAILVGLAQGIAVLPGISRSGITLTMVMFLGLDIKQQMKYVMLISIPVILGVFLVFELPSLIELSKVGGEKLMLYLVSFFVSMLVGLVSLKFFSYLIIQSKVYYFSYYLVIFAAVVYYFSKF